MTISSAIAPGKAILFGEHSVVYGRPAIAIPINEVNVKVEITSSPNKSANSIHLISPQITLNAYQDELPENHPLNKMLHIFKTNLSLNQIPACEIKIESTIPISSGFGSGAAVSVALIRALAKFLRISLSDSSVSDLAFEMEKIHHGNPSGIDNTVITFEQPIIFEKRKPFIQISLKEPLNLVIAGTGKRSNTKKIISEVREKWMQDKTRYEKHFDGIANIVNQSKSALENGNLSELGILMDANHKLLQQIGVSSVALDHLTEKARYAGALGAKLSGAGKGGNIIALVTIETSPGVIAALQSTKAEFVFQSILQATDKKDH
jgi:mevalonate kinase